MTEPVGYIVVDKDGNGPIDLEIYPTQIHAEDVAKKLNIDFAESLGITEKWYSGELSWESVYRTAPVYEEEE